MASNSILSCTNVCFLAPVPPTPWHQRARVDVNRQRRTVSWSVQQHKPNSSVHNYIRHGRSIISNSLATDIENNKRTFQQTNLQTESLTSTSKTTTKTATPSTTKSILTQTAAAAKTKIRQPKRKTVQTDDDDNVHANDDETEPAATNNNNHLQHMRVFNRDWYISGRTMLFLTPILWSGYGVSIKYMYSLPWSLSTPVFNLLRLGLASLIVLPGFIQYLKEDPKRIKSSAVVGGLEIGTWTFLVNILQMLGLQHSSASIAAFLCQLNSVFVPFAAFFCGMENSIGLLVYVASVLSVVGVALFSLDDFAMPFSFQGEGVLVMSAFAATAFILRSKTHSSHSDFNAVLAAKILVQFVIASVYAIPTLFDFVSTQVVAHGGGGVDAIPHAFASLFDHATPMLMLINLLVVIYNGVGVSWLSTVFQLKGQSSVSATEACVTFSSSPIWSAVMALPLGERFGTHGMVGAGMIVLATLLASIKSPPRPEKTPAQDV